MAKRLGTVRVRTTLAATVVVGLAMAVGAVALVIVLRDTLTREVRTAAGLRATDVASALEASNDPGALAIESDEDAVVQVLDARSTVVAASSQLRGRPPVARLRPGESAQVPALVENDPYVVVATAAETPNGRYTVLAARSSETVGESTRTVAGLLALGLPVLLLVVAATTWAVVGRALAPVEAIRREVDEISAAELHRRVPDPAGSDEIARLARTMNRMLDRLERAQARQRRFVSDASHELRSPVASIRQHTEVALAHPGRTATAELASTVLAEDLRIQNLVEDLLVLARADERTLSVRRQPLDLDDLVLEETRRVREATDVRIDTTAVSGGRVGGDAAGLRRVVRNLAENAVRHARGRVSFHLVEQDGFVTFAVDDDGPGVPPAERERVLERFVRLDDARARDSGGSGLGLAIVSELVRAHGGSVSIDDSPLGGARVEVRLPVLADDDAS